MFIGWVWEVNFAKSGMDRRFEEVIASIDRLGDKLDYRDEKQRAFTLQMFTIAIAIT